MQEPHVNFGLVEDLKDYVLAQGDVNEAILHLCVAMCEMCDTEEEALTITKWCYRINDQYNSLTDRQMYFAHVN